MTDFLKAIRDVLPWVAGLAFLPKLVVSLLIVGVAALLLLLIWVPKNPQSVPPSSEARVEGAKPGASGTNTVPNAETNTSSQSTGNVTNGHKDVDFGITNPGEGTPDNGLRRSKSRGAIDSMVESSTKMDVDTVKRLAAEYEGALVELVLRNGMTRRGTVQAPPPNTTLDALALFDERRSGEAPKGQSAVSLEEYRKLVDLIPINEVKSITKIETTISGLVVKTELGKPINQDGMEVHIRNIGKPGYVGASYKMPGAETWSPESVLPIVNREISLPVTMAFISYAKENRRMIEDVIKRLRGYDIFVWDDESLLLPGDDWEAKIEHAIESADYFLLFLSADTIDRDGYKNREMRLALKKQSMKAPGRRFVIPILIDQCEPPDDLRALHWLRMWEDDWEAQLLRAIAPLHIRQRAVTDVR